MTNGLRSPSRDGPRRPSGRRAGLDVPAGPPQGAFDRRWDRAGPPRRNPCPFGRRERGGSGALPGLDPSATTSMTISSPYEVNRAMRALFAVSESTPLTSSDRYFSRSGRARRPAPGERTHALRRRRPHRVPSTRSWKRTPPLFVVDDRRPFCELQDHAARRRVLKDLHETSAHRVG